MNLAQGITPKTLKGDVLKGAKYGGRWPADYTADLTDGVAADALTFSNQWFAFYYSMTDGKPNEGMNVDVIPKEGDTPEKHVGTAVLDLGESCTIDKVSINLFLGSSSGIVPPKSVKVEISEDGETFNEVQTKTYEKPADGDGTVKKEDFAGETAVTGRYVRVSIELNGTFAFLNEIEVWGVKGATTPSESSEPTETTSEPTETTSEPTETTSEPTETTSEPTETTSEPTSDVPSDTPSDIPSDTSSDIPSDASSETSSGPVIVKETIKVDGKLDDLGWTSKNASFAKMDDWFSTDVDMKGATVSYAVRSDDNNVYIAVQIARDWTDISADLPLSGANTDAGKAEVDKAVVTGSRIRLWIGGENDAVAGFYDIVRQNGKIKTFFGKVATTNITAGIDGDTIEICLPKTGDVTIGDTVKLAVNYSDNCFGEDGKAYNQIISCERPKDVNYWSSSKCYTEFNLKTLALGEVELGNESSDASSSNTTSTANSSAATSSTATTSQSKPGAGDAGIIVFTVIGVIALAGAVVAIRVRH